MVLNTASRIAFGDSGVMGGVSCFSRAASIKRGQRGLQQLF
jgi:hypothetical protein